MLCRSSILLCTQFLLFFFFFIFLIPNTTRVPLVLFLGNHITWILPALPCRMHCVFLIKRYQMFENTCSEIMIIIWVMLSVCHTCRESLHRGRTDLFVFLRDTFRSATLLFPIVTRKRKEKQKVILCNLEFWNENQA